MIDAIFSLLPYDAVGFIALAASLILTKKVRQKLLARAVLDIPNARSMHAVPTPRGGGLAVMAVIAGGMALFSLFSFFPFCFLFLALIPLCLVSWLDDQKGVNAKWRLGVHLLAATAGSLALGQDATLFGGVLPFWLDRIVLVVSWAWFINLTNFMDGIDGLTGTQSVITALGAGLVLWLENDLLLQDQSLNPDLVLSGLIAGSCLGFLFYNWHPAKIFLGDVGSVPLGFLTGYLFLRLATKGCLPAALILPLYYLADSGITIVRRAVRGEKIWQAHREHFYQRAAAGEGRHDGVVLWILKADLILVFLACLSLFYPPISFLAAIMVVALLLTKLHKSGKKVSS